MIPGFRNPQVRLNDNIATFCADENEMRTKVVDLPDTHHKSTNSPPNSTRRHPKSIPLTKALIDNLQACKTYICALKAEYESQKLQIAAQREKIQSLEREAKRNQRCTKCLTPIISDNINGIKSLSIGIVKLKNP